MGELRGRTTRWSIRGGRPGLVRACGPLLPAGLLSLAIGCGPSADDYAMLRPDAGYPDGGLESVDEPKNVIEHDPLEPWDTSDAGPLSGIFAVELSARAQVVVELEFRQLYRFRLLQHGTELRVRSQTCRLALPSVAGVAELEIPIALEMLMRSKPEEDEGPLLSEPAGVHADLGPLDLSMLLGASLAAPETDPLPTASALATALDEDGDDAPGVTLRANTVLCPGTERIFVALRSAGTFSGTFTSADAVSGEAAPRLERSVLGVSDHCLDAAADLAIDLLPGATFVGKRVGDAEDLDANGNVTCGEIVAAAPALFGDFWK